MKKIAVLLIISAALSACGGGGSSPSSPVTSAGAALPASSMLAHQCASPRSSDALSPLTGQSYGDLQGSITTEKAWIRSYVNETYLWYKDVPTVDPEPYVIGATVPFIRPSNNLATTVILNTNVDIVNAYFNSQRSPLTTASGKPKDQFHFTYLTSEWEALTTSGNVAGFGFEVTLVAAAAPRKAVVAFTSPATPAAQNNVARGAQILTVNGVDVVNSPDLSALNEGLFSPVPGKQYTFEVLDLGSATSRMVTMTAGSFTLTPVQNVGTLPAPNSGVGYMLFTDFIATAESQLIAAVNQLKAANNGAGIHDLVLDLRYNGGGYLYIASELAYMIAGPTATAGKTFEQQVFNDKNPFMLSAAQSKTPFLSVTQGFSTTREQPLPQLGLSRVYVLSGSGTCSASEAVINGLRGIGIEVILIGGTTCGKPYGFYSQDNCSTTYFTVQFQGVNGAGFGDYADGFIPGGAGATSDNVRGCQVADDFTRQLGDPAEARLAAALQYRANGTCPAPSPTAFRMASSLAHANTGITPGRLERPALRENRLVQPQAWR